MFKLSSTLIKKNDFICMKGRRGKGANEKVKTMSKTLKNSTKQRFNNFFFVKQIDYSKFNQSKKKDNRSFSYFHCLFFNISKFTHKLLLFF